MTSCQPTLPLPFPLMYGMVHFRSDDNQSWISKILFYSLFCAKLRLAKLWWRAVVVMRQIFQIKAEYICLHGNP